MVSKKIALIILGITASTIILVLLYFFNPTDTPFAPKCLFKQHTGWSCPGCGLQRFLHAFMHGRFKEAISYNYLLAILIPYTSLLLFERLVFRGKIQKTIKKVIESNLLIYGLCIITVFWIIIRNYFGI